jgi:hypothetical protein
MERKNAIEQRRFKRMLDELFQLGYVVSITIYFRSKVSCSQKNLYHLITKGMKNSLAGRR